MECGEYVFAGCAYNEKPIRAQDLRSLTCLLMVASCTLSDSRSLMCLLMVASCTLPVPIDLPLYLFTARGRGIHTQPNNLTRRRYSRTMSTFPSGTYRSNMSRYIARYRSKICCSSRLI